MIKVLMLVNDYMLHDHVMNFVKDLSARETCKVNGVFVGKYNRTAVTDHAEKTGNMRLSSAEIRALEEQAIEKCISQLSEKGIEHQVHVIRENSLDVIIDESAFADLLVCNDNLDVENLSMHSLISSASCPVVLVPEGSSFFKSVIFSYDGKVSSTFAMKQFANVFEWCGSLEHVYLISVIPENIIEMDYDALVREWMQLHFPTASLHILRGDVRREIPRFINEHPQSIVVMGAYGRSALSRFFKESLAPLILDTTCAPLFIAHN